MTTLEGECWGTT